LSTLYIDCVVIFISLQRVVSIALVWCLISAHGPSWLRTITQTPSRKR
jgi:hypothetical protein